MPNNVGPVNIEFVLENTNFKAEAEKMKSEIGGVTDAVKQSAAKMTSSMGDFSSQSAKEMKQSIEIQKQAIKDLQQQIKELSSKSATGGNYKENLANQGILANAKKDLLAEQGALISMQKELTAANAAEAASHNPIIAGLSKWVIGLVSVVAAMELSKKIIESTEATAHKFEQGMAAASSATSYFFKSLASGDFSNFLQGMEAAINAGVEYVNKMEDIQNRQNEQKIKGSQIDKDIAILREDTFDKSIANNDNVINSLTKIIGLTKEKYAVESKTASDLYDATLTRVAIENKMDKNKLDNLLSEYTANKQNLELGKEYNKELKNVQELQNALNMDRGGGAKFIVPQLNAATNNLNSLSADAKEAGRIVAEYEKVTFKEKDSLADLKAKAIELDKLSQIGSRRDENQLAAAINKKKTDEADIAKKQKEAAELENQIKDTKERMNTASGPELKDLAQKLTLLENQLAIRKKIIELETSQAWRSQFDGQSMTPMESKGISPIIQKGSIKSVQGVLYEVTAIDKTGPTWTKVKAQYSELKKFEKEQDKKADKEQDALDKEKAAKKKRSQEEIQRQALEFLDNMLLKYGEMLGMSEAEAGLISSLARGDYFAAAFNMIDVLSKFFKAEKDGITEYYSNLNDQTKKLIDNLDLVNNSLSNIGKSGNYQSFNVLSSMLLKLKNDAARLNEQLIITGSVDNRRGSTSQGASTGGNRTDEEGRARTILDLSKQTAELYAEIEKLTYKLLDPNLTEDQRTAIIALLTSYNSIIDSINSSIQEITGTTVQDLSNSLIDAFLSGEDAATQWGDTVDGIIKNVIKKQLVAQLLTKPITEAINMLISDSADGLTPDEASKFTKSLDSLYLTTKPIFDLINSSYKTAGIDLIGKSNQSSALTGITASLTEDTGSLLVGTLMAVRTDIKSILISMASSQDDVSKNLLYMKQIVDNTAPIYRLKAIEEGIVEMNKSLKEMK